MTYGKKDKNGLVARRYVEWTCPFCDDVIMEYGSKKDVESKVLERKNVHEVRCEELHTAMERLEGKYFESRDGKRLAMTYFVVQSLGGEEANIEFTASILRRKGLLKRWGMHTVYVVDRERFCEEYIPLGDMTPYEWRTLESGRPGKRTIGKFLRYCAETSE